MELFRALGLAEIKKINLKKNIGVTCNLPSGHLELVIYKKINGELVRYLLNFLKARSHG